MYAELNSVMAKTARSTRSNETPLGSFDFVPLIAVFFVVHWAAAWVRTQPFSRGLSARASVAIPIFVIATLLVTIFGTGTEVFVYFQF